MKYLSIFYIVISLLTNLLFAQSPDEKKDPLLGNYKIGDSGEIIMLWAEAFGDEQVFQKIYDLNQNNDALDLGNKRIQTGTFDQSLVMDLVTGDLNGDGSDDLIAAWTNSEGSIELIIPEIENLEWTNVNKFTVNGGKAGNNKLIRLAAGYFDDDPEVEFALAFWAEDETIKLYILDTEGSLTPIIKDSMVVGNLNPLLYEGARFDMTVGDFDGDRKDEIIITSVEKEAVGSNWNLYTQVYDYNENEIITKIKQNDIYTSDMAPESSYRINRLVAATGDFTGNTLDEVVIGFQIFKSDDETYVYLQPLQISEDLDSINFNSINLLEQNEILGNHGWPMSIVTGDLNQDGRDEIVSAAIQQVNIYESDPTLQFTKISQLGLASHSDDDAHRILALADMDGNSTEVWLPEIVIAENVQVDLDINIDSEFQIRVFSPKLDSLGALEGFELKAQLSDEITDPDVPRPLALALGDFNGDGVTLRPPKRYRRTDILHPLVILKAPPIHFDVFDDVAFDVSRSFGTNEPAFFSKYEWGEERTEEVKTELNEDWAKSLKFGNTFTIDAQVVSTNVDLFFTKKWGKGFSNSSRKSQTVKISSDITARVDDQIYAMVVDYDIWEYPVIADGNTNGNMIVLTPTLKENRWFPSKSRSGGSYVPSHEVGNILSYQEYANLEDNDELALKIKGAFDVVNSVVLDATTDFNWSLAWNDFNQGVVDTTNTKGRESGYPLYGPTITFNGEYNAEEISTYTTTVSKDLSMRVHLDGIDVSIGETGYLVTNYAYWGNNGALVVDYAARPELSAPGETPTWWQVRYGEKPDPAFILPWRYDPEKGIAIEEEAKRQQTKEISFNPKSAAPGDTVNIKARIHNYSLLPTAGTVDVQFYIGDPNDGGTLIVGNSGETKLTTEEVIPSRGKTTVQMSWTVPIGIPQFPRIYAVIDPDKEIDEIHENNNIGWTVLGQEEITTGIEGSANNQVPSSFSLKQNFPNPFNPSTIIKYSIPSSGMVKLQIFDILGREIKTVVNEYQTLGNYNIKFDGSNLVSGVYIYSLRSGQYFESRKMLILK